MARKYRTHIREEKAVEFRLTIGDISDYKNAWLVINNNAREYRDCIYKVWNNSHSDIFVLCNPNEEIAVRDFLSQFSDGYELIRDDEDKYAVFVDIECDYSDFDKDYIDAEYVFGETD